MPRTTRREFASVLPPAGWNKGIILVLLLCCLPGANAQAQEKKTCSPPVDERLGTYACQKLLDRELAQISSRIAESIRPGLPGLLRDDQLPKQKQLFLDAQRAWEVFRARTCEAEAYENRDTSGYSASMGSCWIRLTQARVDELRNGRWGVLLGTAAAPSGGEPLHRHGV
jgi:uncharacterized protein YecT (DUF1311 family)